MATWDDPAHDDECGSWSRETASAIQRWTVNDGYANYMQADEPMERVRPAFGAKRSSVSRR